MANLASEPCPGCAEGWRLVGDMYCAECYDGQIERLRKALREIDAVAFGKKAGAIVKMQRIARDALAVVGNVSKP